MVAARQRARQIAALLGFDAQDQTRIATAVSEIARNAFSYARRRTGRVPVEGEPAPQVLRGPRSATRARASPDLDGDPRRPLPLARPGMGLGIVGARRLMDRFDIESAPARHRRHAAEAASPAAAPPSRRRRSATVAAQRWRREPHRDPLDEVQRAEPGAAAQPRRAAGAAGGARRAQRASSRTPTAASSRSTPSSTRRPTSSRRAERD